MKGTMKYFIALGLGAALSAQSASAVPITGTVTADNFYALYYGEYSGAGMTFVGRNESTDEGSPGLYNWSQPETFSFDTDEYIYIAAWSDNKYSQGLLGQFVVSGFPTLYTNTTDWEVYLTYEDRGVGDPAPTTSEMAAYVATANAGSLWTTINTSGDHGDPNLPYPGVSWGLISGISPLADWVWQGPTPGTGFLEENGGFGEVQIYRTRRQVPEPATMLLLGSGLVGFGALRRRARNA